MRPVRRASLAIGMKTEQVVASELHARPRAALDVRDGTTNRAERLARGGIECSVCLGGSHEVGIVGGPHHRRAPSGSVVAENGNAGNRRCDEHAAKDRAWCRTLHSGLRCETAGDHVMVVVAESSLEGSVESDDPAFENRSLPRHVSAVERAVFGRKKSLFVGARRHLRGRFHQNLRRGANAATGERHHPQQPHRDMHRTIEWRTRHVYVGDTAASQPKTTRSCTTRAPGVWAAGAALPVDRPASKVSRHGAITLSNASR
jgi:hypothetical protein